MARGAEDLGLRKQRDRTGFGGGSRPYKLANEPGWAGKRKEEKRGAGKCPHEKFSALES